MADKEHKQRIVLVKPPRKISEMTDAELDEFARKIWRGVAPSRLRPSG